MQEHKLYSRQPKVLGVEGSPRKNGNSHVLLEAVLNGVIEGQQISTKKTSYTEIHTEAVHLRDYQFSSCIGCERCRKDRTCTGLQDGMTLLYPKIRAARALVLVSPVHHYNVTAWMKAFIDRLYCFYTFADTRPRKWSSRLANRQRKAVLIAICEQDGKDDFGFTLDAMRRPLTGLGYRIVGEMPVYGVFDRGIIVEQSDVMKHAFELGKELARYLLYLEDSMEGL